MLHVLSFFYFMAWKMWFSLVLGFLGMKLFDFKLLKIHGYFLNQQLHILVECDVRFTNSNVNILFLL